MYVPPYIKHVSPRGPIPAFEGVPVFDPGAAGLSSFSPRRLADEAPMSQSDDRTRLLGLLMSILSADTR